MPYLTAALALLLSFLGAWLAHVWQRRRQHPQALPVDPEDPPTYAAYVRGHGEPEETCSCHGEPIADGELILVWPLPSRLLCERTYRQVGR